MTDEFPAKSSSNADFFPFDDVIMFQHTNIPVNVTLNISGSPISGCQCGSRKYSGQHWQVRQIGENPVSEIYWINGGIRLLYRQKHSVFRIGHAYPWIGLSSYEPAYLSTRPDVHAPDYRWVCRMLHSPSLVAIGLSVGHKFDIWCEASMVRSSGSLFSVHRRVEL